MEALQTVGFAGLAPEARAAALPFIEANWGALTRDPASLEALRSAAFVQTGELGELVETGSGSTCAAVRLDVVQGDVSMQRCPHASCPVAGW